MSNKTDNEDNLKTFGNTKDTFSYFSNFVKVKKYLYSHSTKECFV